MSLKNLLNKSKGLQDETQTPILDKLGATKSKPNMFNKLPAKTKPIEPAKTIQPATKQSKPKPFKLGIGVAKTKPISTNEEQSDSLLNSVRYDSPLKELASVVQSNSVLSDNSISSILGDISDEITSTSEKSNAEASQESTSIQQNSSRSATLDDLSKFVFAEQPDESTEEIAMKFSGMLDSLLDAVGSDIPTVLSDTLKFMKEHAFLAEILKPAEIGKLVQTMAKSYGYVATNQVQKSAKRVKKAAEQNDILNSLDMLKF